ncbi:MAG TPA: hypothetical protein VFP59_10390 [Candidatus Angelobacter sp.]|nr:hypothetical protein [Candidatus Angelobacter sp.]
MKKIWLFVLTLALTGALAQAQTKDKDQDKDMKAQAKTAQAAPEGSAKEEAMERSVHITSGPNVANLTGTSATLQWETNKNAANDVHYNCGGKNKIAYDRGGSTNHSVTLTGLKPNSTCTWKIMTREKQVRKAGTFHTPGM